MLIIYFCALKKNKKKIKKEIYSLVNQFDGDVRVYVKHLKLNFEFGINEERLMPTASLIKIPILIKIFDRIEKNELSLDSVVTYYKDSID